MSTTNGMPLNDVLVMLHGNERAADILTRLFLVPEWPSCGGPHTKKCNCGGSPTDLFSPEAIEVVKQWVAHMTAAPSNRAAVSS